MKKCNSCGSQVNDEVAACPNCGGTGFTYVQPAQPMPQPPAYNPPVMNPNAGNMPMTFATVYTVLLVIGVIMDIPTLVKDFSVSALISVLFSAALAFFLYKRMKVGRILVMISNILSAVIGIICTLVGILLAAGMSVISTEVEIIAALGAAVGFIFILVGAFVAVFGICSFIYFKKRASMYLN